MEDLTATLANFLAGGEPNRGSASIDAMDALVERFAAAVRIARKRSKGEYDLFLCHNSTDKPEVREIGERLKERGYLPWLDEWDLRPGMSWQTDIQQQLRRVRGAAIFVGGSGIGPWQDVETQAILREFIERKAPAIPVILPSCKAIPELPLFLKGHTWVDFRILAPDPFRRLIWGITGHEDDASPAAPRRPRTIDKRGRG